MRVLNYLSLVILIGSLFSCGDSSSSEETNSAEIKKEEAQKHETMRIDSLTFYNHLADSLFEAQNVNDGIVALESALKFSKNEDSLKILRTRAIQYVQLKEYDRAIRDYSLLILDNKPDKDLYFERADCYINTKNTQYAVNDLKEAIALGHPEASKIHDKINPLKKRIIRYITRCCDGTESTAKGKGACSRHKGVCDWNEPVYEEYRDY